MSKSIIQRKDGICYLCEKLYGGGWHQQVEEHHCFDAANRHLSEHYGLKVYLCLGHHRTSKEAVHQNAEMMRLVQRDAQKAFESKYTDLNFREIFGRNYLDEEPEELHDISGFIPLEEAI